MKRGIPARALIGYLFIFLVSLSACNPLTSRSVEGNISVDYKSATPESDVIQYVHDAEPTSYVLFLINNSVSMTAQERYQIPIFYISLLNSKASEHKNAWVGISSFPDIYSANANGIDAKSSYVNLMEFQNITSNTDLSGLISLPEINLNSISMGESVKSATEEFNKSNNGIADDDKKALVIVTDNDSQDNNDLTVQAAINAALKQNINVYVVVFPSSTTPISENWWKRLETTVHDNDVAEFTVFDIQTDISQITQTLYEKKFFGDILPKDAIQYQPNTNTTSTPQNLLPMTLLQQIGSKSFETPGDTFKLEIYGVTPTPNATFELQLGKDEPLKQVYSLISDQFGRFQLNILVKPTMDCSKRNWTLIGPPAYFWWNARTPEFTINNLAEIDGIRVNEDTFEMLFDVSSPYEMETDINSLIQDFGQCYTLNFFVVNSQNTIYLGSESEGPRNSENILKQNISLKEAYTELQNTGYLELTTKDKNLLCNGTVTIKLETPSISPAKLLTSSATYRQYYQPEVETDDDLIWRGDIFSVNLMYLDRSTDFTNPKIYILRAEKKLDECELNANFQVIDSNDGLLSNGAEVCLNTKCRDYHSEFNNLYWTFENNKTIDLHIPEIVYSDQCLFQEILIEWGDKQDSADTPAWKSIHCFLDKEMPVCDMHEYQDIHIKSEDGNND